MRKLLLGWNASAAACVLLAVVLLPPPACRAGSASDRARETWMAGYLKVQEAARAEQAGQDVTAAKLYREALKAFQQVHKQFPAWNPSLINYRIVFCKTRLERVGRHIDANLERLSKDELTRLVRQLRQDAADSRREMAALKREMQLLKDEITGLKEKAAAGAEATKALAELRKKQDALLAKLAAQAKDIQKISDLKKALRRQKRAAKKAERRAEKAEARQKEIETKLAKLTAEKKHLEDTVDSLQTHIDTLEKQLKKARKDYDELNDSYASYRARKEREIAEYEKKMQELAALKPLPAKLDEADKALQALRDQLDETRKKDQDQIQTLRQRLSTTQDQLLAAEKKQRQCVEEKMKLADTLAKSKEQITALTRKLAAMGAVDVDKLNQKIRDLSARLQQSQRNLADAKTRLLTLEEQEKRRAAEAEQRRKQEIAKHRKARARLEKIHGLLAAAADAEKTRDFEKAVWNFRKVLEMDPENKAALTGLGILLVRRGQDSEAEKVLEKAFKMDPDNPQLLAHLGLALARQQKADLAISCLARAVALDPKNADYHKIYAVSCRSLGWTDAAEAELRRAFKLKPDADAAYNLAVLLATDEPPRYDEAAKWYATAKKLGAKPDPAMEQVLRTHTKR